LSVDRTQRLLAVVLAAQIALLAVFHFAFRSSRAAEEEQPLLPSLAAMTPRKVEIGDGTGASVALVREGKGWTLENPAGYPADSGKVEKLIDDVEGLRVGRPVVSNRRNHAALKVADDTFERRLRIWEKPEGKPSATLYVGTSSRSQSSHVRVGGKDPVFEAGGLSAYDLAVDPGSWVERNLVAVEAESVGVLAIWNSKGSFELEKRNGLWSVRSPAARARLKLDPQQVESLARTLCAMSLDAPAGKVGEAVHGLTAPEATVTLGRASAPGGAATAAIEVRIGAAVPGKENERYASRSGFGYAFTVNKFAVDRALTVTLSELTAK
jgi:hypothetical protein